MDDAQLASFANILKRFGLDQGLQEKILSAFDDYIIWTPWGPPVRGDMEQLKALKAAAKPRE